MAPDTILIALDSMLQNIDEHIDCVKVNSKQKFEFLGVALSGIPTNIYPPYYEKTLSTWYFMYLLMIRRHKKVSKDLLDLMNYIESAYGMSVIICEPITRYDNDALACLRVHHLQDNLQKSDIRIMVNSIMTRKNVGRGGLHLNNYGTALVAMNLISLVKCL